MNIIDDYCINAIQDANMNEKIKLLEQKIIDLENKFENKLKILERDLLENKVKFLEKELEFERIKNTLIRNNIPFHFLASQKRNL